MGDYTNDTAESDRPMGPADEPTSSGNGAAMAITGMGGLSSAYSQFESGRVNEKIARTNANYARVQAEQARTAGDFAANRRAMVQRQISGQTQAAQAAGGSVVGAGTNALVVKGQENASAMDQFLIKLNASRQAGAIDMRAAGDDLTGNMARRAGESGAIGSLLNTGSNEWLLSDSGFDPRFGRGLAVGGGGN